MNAIKISDIYDCQEKDAGKYDVSLFDFKGNETKVTYKLIVEGNSVVKRNH